MKGGHIHCSPTEETSQIQDSQERVTDSINLGNPSTPELFVGNVKINLAKIDNIANAFLNSSRKTLRYIPPQNQKDEIIIRPTTEMVEPGSKRWQSTAVGYFLGKKPYFPQLEAFAKTNWKGLQQTEDGLSAVASGIGTPLYTDKITKTCSRLDFARVCVMLDYQSKLTKHLIVLSPILREGKEMPMKVDIEYEWLPLHWTVFVQKKQSTSVDSTRKGDEVEATRKQVGDDVDPCPNNHSGEKVDSIPATYNSSTSNPLGSVKIDEKGMQPEYISSMITVATWNVRGLNSVGHQDAVGRLVRDKNIQFLGLLETRVRLGNIQIVRSRLLTSWSWFEDYTGPGGRIWLAWNALEVDVEILRVEEQFIHSKITNKRMHNTCLISVVYGDCDVIRRRELWGGLCTLSEDIIEEPWCVSGDFNAVVDASEICAEQFEANNAMVDFRERLDRIMVNEAWLVKWPQSSYLSALPSTSDHSPLILLGRERSPKRSIFRFDNFLARQPGFLFFFFGNCKVSLSKEKYKVQTARSEGGVPLDRPRDLPKSI
ncbi:UNVERIFIED_CONTAM: hypothetical protein Slati_2455600 [Sesamum latifolium]|uniref:Endonuclease/exonuclease/phosphatase domain-containing protein n=1 Tax=Sesamum latifolium TaxID=2727402 RepID=A0AAW2WFZ9_9LAMI